MRTLMISLKRRLPATSATPSGSKKIDLELQKETAKLENIERKLQVLSESLLLLENDQRDSAVPPLGSAPPESLR